MKNFISIEYKVDNLEINIRVLEVDKSIWLSQKEISMLFNCSLNSINKQINHILKEHSESYPTIANLAEVREENGREVRRKIKLYHQKLIEEIGLRKHSNNFDKIKEFVLKYLNQKSIENNNIIIYDNGIAKVSLNVSYEEQTVWATKKEIAEVFLTSVPDINYHIKRIIEEGELDTNSVIKWHLNTDPDGKKYNNIFKEVLLNEESTCAKFEHVVPNLGRQYKTTIYNLDVINYISLRLKTNRIILLKEFVINYFKDYEIDDKRSDIIISDNGKVHISVVISRLEQTIWANEPRIADLFEVSRQTIHYHINNILNDKELEPISVCKEILHTGLDGKQYLTTFYSLDMILAIGYRVNSKVAISFRQWATKVLSEINYLKGY